MGKQLIYQPQRSLRRRSSTLYGCTNGKVTDIGCDPDFLCRTILTAISILMGVSLVSFHICLTMLTYTLLTLDPNFTSFHYQNSMNRLVSICPSSRKIQVDLLTLSLPALSVTTDDSRSWRLVLYSTNKTGRHQQTLIR
jgi:hypothetical protein